MTPHTMLYISELLKSVLTTWTIHQRKHLLKRLKGIRSAFPLLNANLIIVGFLLHPPDDFRLSPDYRDRLGTSQTV